MELQVSPNVANEVSAMETVSEAIDSPEEGYGIAASDSLDFDSWTSLISEIEKTYSDNIKAISSVYESFLSQFPLCHGYWKRYADHKARLCTVAKAVEIFERAVQSATYSVGLWVDYCSFSVFAFVDPSDIRRVFERGLSFVGKDFLCHSLWDMYIRFELSQQQWSFLAHILIRSLKFPTKSLHKYHDNFREFVAFVEEDMSLRNNCNLEPHAAVSDVEVATSHDEIYHIIKELQDSSNVELRSKALYKFTAIGEQFYRRACQLHEEIDYFENYMERDFFHVEPLDNEQLENWHNYLDFIEKQEDFDWAVKLYERCLIPCANYPEFWMRYVEFMESKGGREIANFALERATQVFLKNVSQVHIFNAQFREKIGDIEGARAAFLLCDSESDSSFIETAIKEANMEKRLGNLDTALDVYDKALKMAAEKEKLHVIPILYIHFFRLKYLITGSADAAIDLLIAGIQCVRFSRLLLEELINFAMMHEGSRHLNVVDTVMVAAISCGPDDHQGLCTKDREDLSHLYLKFLDYCGTTDDIRKAWNRHIKSFPHLIRSTSSHKHPANRLSNELAEVRERIPHLVAKQPSGIRGIEHRVRVSANETQKLLVSKNHAIVPHETMVHQYGEKDDDSVKENTPESAFQQSEDDDAAREFRRLKHQSKDDASRSIDMIHDMVLPSQEATSGPNEIQVSQKDNQLRTDEEHQHEVEAPLKPVSLESLSLCARDKESNDLTTRSQTALKDTMPSVIHENPYTASGNCILTSESAKKQNGKDEHESESLSYSPGHRNLRRQTDLQQEVRPENVKASGKTNHMLTSSEDVSPDSDGQSRQHQCHQSSPLVQSTAHMGGITQVPNEYCPNATEGPNLQPQNSSASQLHVSPQPVHSHLQAQMVQYPAQNNEQLGLMQNTQAYNQMLQYQYQQQQYQQQVLQMQQSYLMQQQQQPYTQQQQQYFQQQQQLQPQQYQLYQQQEQYQQYQVLYQQQQEQGYQQLMQQHQLQEYLQFQQYQQMPPQQPQDVHQNHQQQIAAMYNQIWNSSHDQQGQGMTLPHTTSTHTGFETLYAQQKSGHMVAQPTITSASTNVASSSNLQQSSHAAPSSSSPSLHSQSSQQTPQT